MARECRLTEHLIDRQPTLSVANKISRDDLVSGALPPKGPVAAHRVDVEPVPTVGAAPHHFAGPAAHPYPGMRCQEASWPAHRRRPPTGRLLSRRRRPFGGLTQRCGPRKWPSKLTHTTGPGTRDVPATPPHAHGMQGQQQSEQTG